MGKMKIAVRNRLRSFLERGNRYREILNTDIDRETAERKAAATAAETL